jgi:endonuclease/exonuclease/phosphatase (EEP) superfamily protein YafD
MSKQILFASVLALFFILSALVHLTIEDSVIGFSTWYYATPWSLLSGAALVAALLFLKNKHFKFAFFLLLGAAATTTLWLYTGFHHNQQRDAADAIKLMFWNADHVRYGVSKAIVQVRDIDADIVGIVEAGREKEIKEEWKNSFGEQSISPLFGEMLILTKGTILEKEANDLAPHSRYNWIKLAIKDKEISILLVDIPPTPLDSREPAFDELRRVIALHRNENLIIMGDFNTPSDSVFFEPLRNEFHHAFEQSGNGFSATWPVPVPLLTIDHIWTNKNFQLYETHLVSSWSDHKAIVTDVGLNN